MKIVFLVGIFCVVCTSVGEAAKFLAKDLALLHYTGSSFQPSWLAEGAFAAVLQHDRQAHQQNAVLNYSLKGLRKKIKIAFSPKVILKPVIIVEQLQTLFLAYQSQKQEAAADGNGQTNSNAQAKTRALDGLAPAKRSGNSGAFLFSPYYHRVYGIHLQILW